MLDLWSYLWATRHSKSLSHSLRTLRDNNVGALDLISYPQCATQEKQKSFSCHIATLLYLFMHWRMSYTISPPCSSGPDRPSDPSIIQPTICLVPQTFCHHYCGRVTGRRGGWWEAERMSGPLLIRAMTESRRPSVGGQQAPPGPLSQTEELTGTFPCGHRQTILPEKLQEIWEILLKCKREKLSETVCQLHANGWDTARLCGWWIKVFTHTFFLFPITILQSATE